MSVLFEPYRIGPVETFNRFIRSATHEGRADGQGRVTPEVLAHYRSLAAGGIGTIITGIMSVRQDGKGSTVVLGIDRDDLVPGLRELASTMKAEGSRAVFQLHHAGGQALKRVTGGAPRSASRDRRPLSTRLVTGTQSPLRVDELPGVVAAFGAAARRAREAGADGVQVHAAHGYLLSEFLSPAFNHRDDGYGGDVDGRYRLLGEVVAAVRAELDGDMALLVKMNVDDAAPDPAMTPALAAEYASRLARDGVDCLEISAGGTVHAPFAMCRGEAPTRDFASFLPWPLRLGLERTLRATARPPFEEAYNSPGLAPVRAALGEVSLALVGGMRTLSVMEDCVASGAADLISLSRPFVREPRLVSRFRTDPAATASCISCNRCLAACYHELPVRCYVKGLPSAKVLS